MIKNSAMRFAGLYSIVEWCINEITRTPQPKDSYMWQVLRSIGLASNTDLTRGHLRIFQRRYDTATPVVS